MHGTWNILKERALTSTYHHMSSWQSFYITQNSVTSEPSNALSCACFTVWTGEEEITKGVHGHVKHRHSLLSRYYKVSQETRKYNHVYVHTDGTAFPANISTNITTLNSGTPSSLTANFTRIGQRMWKLQMFIYAHKYPIDFNAPISTYLTATQ